MAETLSKASPDGIRYIIKAIKENGNLTKTYLGTSQLADKLFNKGYTSADCHPLVQKYIREGLLIAKSKKSPIFRLAHPDELERSGHEIYCFECHLPGELIPCRECTRAFHANCIRRKPEHSKYKVADSNEFKKQFVNYDTDDSDEQPTQNKKRITTQAKDAPRIEPERTSQSNGDEIAEFCTAGTKLGCDVIYMGQLRKPIRRNLASDMCKLEWYDEPTNVSNDKMELCTCCRLMQVAAIRQPPELGPEELCYLIKFSLDHHRFRVKSDVSTFFKAKKFTTAEIDVACGLFFPTCFKHIESIDNKIANKEYKYLLEVLVDLLDIQHTIGVFYGAGSEEYVRFSYLERFMYYDISEIIRCPDCFRNSNEMHTEFWFAKPCLQRHEVVMAKIQKYPYWPAKVLGVVHNNQYDVRFFGGKHERSLVPASNIIFNDNNINDNRFYFPQNRKERVPKIMKAINEMRLYNLLSIYSPSYFSYHADKTHTEQLIFSLIGWNHDDPKLSEVPPHEPPLNALRSRDRTRKNYTSSNNLSTSMIENPPPFVTTRYKSKARTNSTNASPNEKKSINRASISTIAKYKLENQKLKKENEKLKQKIKYYLAEQNVIKSKQWCPTCFNEITDTEYYRYSYCSIKCRLNNGSKRKLVTKVQHPIKQKRN